MSARPVPAPAPRRASPTAAVRHLRVADATLARVIDAVGPCRYRPRSEGSHFDALLRSIVYQQVSGAAAATVLGRLCERYGGRHPTPAELLATPEPRLRAAGLSRQKQSYLRSLAEHVEQGALPLDRVHAMSDADVIDALVAVKGIGTWTAQMFLMFRLARPDVLPTGDLGIQKAVQRAYRMRKLPRPARLEAVARPWAPHRTIACWYLWRSLDGEAAI